jgi:uncharacterized protein YjbI with pentapeptide repeats
VQEINHDLFINPGNNLEEGSSELNTVLNLSKSALKDRWESQTGKYILNRWKANNFDRPVLEGMVGKYYGRVDIRGVRLVGENLSGVNLNKIDFYGANLEDSVFSGADLTNSWLSESNIRGTDFSWAKMDGVLIDNVDFDHRTRFGGVNITTINFTLATLLHDLAVSQQRIQHLEQRHPILAKFFRITCDYGRSFERFLVCCFSTILFFSLLHALIPNTLNVRGFWNSFYFSITIFTTLGYGNIHPISTLGRIFVITEVSVGFLMLGLLVAILARRIIGD